MTAGHNPIPSGGDCPGLRRSCAGDCPHPAISASPSRTVPDFPGDDPGLAAGCGKYERTLKSGRNTARTDGMLDAQSEHFRQALERSACRTTQMNQVLSEHGVPVTSHVQYRAFTLRVDRLCREYDGGTRRALIAEAVVRWTNYGLSPEVLLAVCKQVFNLDMSASALRLLASAFSPSTARCPAAPGLELQRFAENRE